MYFTARKYLNERTRKITDKVIERNSFFAFSENLLAAMLNDERKHIRQLAWRRCLKARKNGNKDIVRTFKTPKLIFNAEDYINMIDWQVEPLCEPPVIFHLTDEDVNNGILTGDPPTFPGFPCHTQAVERHIKLVTEASGAVSSEKNRDGYIKSKLLSRTKIPKFETKRQYVA